MSPKQEDSPSRSAGFSDLWLIWSYEHDAWWGPGLWGYTPTLAEAGPYSRAEAERIVARANVVTVNEVAVPLAEAPTFPGAMADEALVVQAAHEITALPPGGVELVLRPQSAFGLATVLQLALRHPGLTGEPQQIAVTALEHIRGYFTECPAVTEMLRRGDDPEHDR